MRVALAFAVVTSSKELVEDYVVSFSQNVLRFTRLMSTPAVLDKSLYVLPNDSPVCILDCVDAFNGIVILFIRIIMRRVTQ